MELEQKQINLATPIAIVIAGALIAVALYFGTGPAGTNTPQQPQATPQASGNLGAMASVRDTDHIRGNPDAPVKIVEYSDTECPFCKRFHDTMKQVMEEYGSKGTVAWIYRHFPLDQLHPKADKEAEALECANELGGNDAFWTYIDRLFEVTPSNNGLDLAELPRIAEYVGLDARSFTVCLESGKYAAYVEEDTQNALKTGGEGTPWSIVISKKGKRYPLSGAQPYEAVKQIIENALKN